MEVIKRGYEAWNRGDMAALLEVFDPNIEWWDREDDPETTVRRGHQAVRGRWAETPELFAEFRIEPQEFVDAGEYVVAPVRITGLGRASGAPFEEHEVHVFRLRDGKAIELREYREKKEALEAVGLEEQARSATLDLVRSIYADWERGDFSSAEWADPEIEFVIADGPAPGSWRGLAEMAEGTREQLYPWEDFRLEAEEFRELGHERVLVFDHAGGRGKTSGLDVAQMQSKKMGARLFHVRGGKVTRLVFYWDRDRVLADLGLAPETG